MARLGRSFGKFSIDVSPVLSLQVGDIRIRSRDLSELVRIAWGLNSVRRILVEHISHASGRLPAEISQDDVRSFLETEYQRGLRWYAESPDGGSL